MSDDATAAPAAVRRRGDVVFAGLARAAGITILVALAGVALFLTLESVPAMTAPSDEADGGTSWSTCGRCCSARCWPRPWRS